MLGEAAFQRVKLTLTDGDSQEFNALDEAIFRKLKCAIRMRCKHQIEKGRYTQGSIISKVQWK